MKKGDDKEPDGYWIDIGQIKVTGKGLNIEKKKTGGPMSDCPKGH